MKKLIALILSLMLVAGIALPVLAEETHKHTIEYDDTMSVEVVIPEGYAVEETTEAGTLIICLTPMNEGNNYIVTLIAHDDDRADVARLNDLSDAELQAVVGEFCDGLNNPTVSYSETGMGTKLIVINDDNVDGGDIAIIVTLYKGCFLTTYVFPDGDYVTDEEIAVAIQFYTDMEFKF